jgi:hypothetical protein
LTVLGVKIGIRASLIEHCNDRAIMASKRVNLMKAISGTGWGANSTTLLTLYKQLIRPILEHGAVATALASPSALLKLVRVERIAIRTALHVSRATRLNDMYVLARIQPLKDRLLALRYRTINRISDQTGMTELDHIKNTFN